MLPSRQTGEVDRRKATDGHGADAVEESVDVADVIASIARIKNARKNQGGECAVMKSKGDQLCALPGGRVECGAQVNEMNAEEIQMALEGYSGHEAARTWSRRPPSK